MIKQHLLKFNILYKCIRHNELNKYNKVILKLFLKNHEKSI